jgi:hypothetical protein
VGVKGNEAVDVLAKQALSTGDVDFVSMTKAEEKSLIWRVIVQRWQQWNRDTKGRHLFEVQRNVGEDDRKDFFLQD